MHPLELQVNDLKEQISVKERHVTHLTDRVKKAIESLDDIKKMLHPSRQPEVERLKRELLSALVF